MFEDLYGMMQQPQYSGFGNAAMGGYGGMGGFGQQLMQIMRQPPQVPQLPQSQGPMIDQPNLDPAPTNSGSQPDNTFVGSGGLGGGQAITPNWSQYTPQMGFGGTFPPSIGFGGGFAGNQRGTGQTFGTMNNGNNFLPMMQGALNAFGPMMQNQNMGQQPGMKSPMIGRGIGYSGGGQMGGGANQPQGGQYAQMRPQRMMGGPMGMQRFNRLQNQPQQPQQGNNGGNVQGQ